MNRPAVALVVAALTMLVAIGASALGLFGGVTACGADRTPGCVTWPAPIGIALWTVFMLGVIALLVWQVRYLDR